MPQRLVQQLLKSLLEAMSPDYLANEAEYWRVRDQLLLKYEGKWVAFDKGQVVAWGDDLMTVMNEAGQKGYSQAYIDKVGEEGELRVKCRQASFGYNQAYLPTALPQVAVTFTNFHQTRQHTGSDFSALTEEDGHALQLLTGPHVPSSVTGVGGQTSLCVVCRAFATIGGRRFPAMVQLIPGQSDRLLGREVMNQMVVIFDGPNGLVTFQFQ